MRVFAATAPLALLVLSLALRGELGVTGAVYGGGGPEGVRVLDSPLPPLLLAPAPYADCKEGECEYENVREWVCGVVCMCVCACASK